jgi:hypothetical protein
VKPARILNQASSLSDEPERTPDDSPFCVPSFLSPPLCLLSPSVRSFHHRQSLPCTNSKFIEAGWLILTNP